MSALAALYRSISRHPLYSALNIGGLALGIAVFLVLSLFVRHEQSFNRFPGAERLWVMQERYDAPGRPAIDSPHVMGGELDLLRHDFPGLVGARWSAIGGTILRDGEASTENLVLIDPAFLPLFDYSVVAGDAARTLTAPDGVVISQRMARRYFGERSPIGRPLTLMIGRLTQAFTVGAVVADAPRSTEFNGSLFVRMTRDRVEAAAYDHWNVAVGWTFLRFPDADAAHRFEAGLPAFLGRHAFPTGEVKRAEYRQSLRPLAAIHLFLNGERETVATLQVVGALTLLIAIVNYVNLATARAGLRAREVAMRKVLGATRRALIGQFLGEALATVALAALIGLALAELVLPFVNALGGTELAIDYVGANGIVVPLALLVLVVGLAAGTYPALLLSRFQPAAVLASVRAPGGGRAGAQLRQALVMVQFAVAVAFGIGTAIMVAQVAHLRAADMGFQREGLLIVSAIDDRALDPVHRRALLAAFAALPLVTSVTVADEAPSWLPAVASLPFTRPDAPLRKVSATIVPAGPGYFATYGARRLAGRLFDRVHGMDEPAVLTHRDGQLVSVNLILNQSAVRALGFAGPALAIGRSIRGGPFADARVIGVVADLRFTSPREPATPVVYAPGADDIGQNFAVRFTGPADAAASAIEKASRRVAPDLTIQTGTAAEYVEEGYRPDAQRARLFTIGAVLAVVIGCLGLYGLAAFDTARRVKEIGIRKTLGASTSDVLRLLIGQFMRPVLLANLLAWPLAFVAMRRWLSGFDDRVALSPLFFVGASLAAVLISAVTVVGQAWRVARAEPARALRHE